MAKHPKFEIFKGNDDQFYFHLTAKNGEIILSSQGYKTRQGCKNGIESVRKNSQEDGRFKRKLAAGGKFHFNLLVGNNEIIGSSQMYKSAGGRDNGIVLVRENAPTAEAEDTTD